MEPDQAAANRRLPAARFTNKPKSLTRKNFERNIVNRPDNVIAVFNREVFYEVAYLD
jgi:hypothetical protein